MNSVEWFEKLRTYAEDHPDVLELMGEMPEELKKLGTETIIAPHPDHITEEMLDACRGILLSTDTDFKAENMVNSTVRRGDGDIIPQWLREWRGHIPKNAVSHAFYSLMMNRHLKGPREVKRHRRPDHYVTVTMRHPVMGDEKALVWEKILRTSSLKNGVITYNLQFNRHDVPPALRTVFRKEAVRGTIVVGLEDDSGEWVIRSQDIVTAIKPDYVKDFQCEVSIREKVVSF